MSVTLGTAFCLKDWTWLIEILIWCRIWCLVEHLVGQVDSTWWNNQNLFWESRLVINQITSESPALKKTQPSAVFDAKNIWFQDISHSLAAESRDTAVSQCYQSLTLRQQTSSDTDVVKTPTLRVEGPGKSSSLGGVRVCSKKLTNCSTKGDFPRVKWLQMGKLSWRRTQNVFSCPRK